MSPTKSIPEEPKAVSQDEELVIDTSKMSEGKRAALEVTESARQASWDHPTFAGQLFMGKFDKALIMPFPEQMREDKKIGDEFIEGLSSYLKENLDPEEVDATRTIPKKVIDEMMRMGVFAMKVPKAYGGLGFSQVNYNRVMSMLASYCGGTAVLVSAHQSIGVPQPLKIFGTEEQKKKYLPRFREGAISAFALTEPDVGSDPAQMSTNARLSPDGKNYILSGEKLWCTNGPIADLMVVMAQTEPVMVKGKERKQITAFIVERTYPGIEMVHRCDFMGIRGIQNGLLRFKDVKVPKENILLGTGKGLKLALTTLNTGRLTLPAASVGMAKQCLSIVRRWGNQRVQWGLPIGKHEAGAQKISFIVYTTFAMEAVTWITSHWADRGDMDIRIEAAMAKLFCSENAWKIADTTMQFRGGRGYEKASSLKARGEEPFPVERILRDSRINMIIEGTSEIMRLFLAREAMDPHLKIAADLLKKNVPVGKKIKAGLKLAAFYSTWYPQQWINTGLWSSHSEFGRLSNHVHYVEVTCHKLARTIFHYMGLYQDRLERKQLLLTRLMEIGTELFVMATTCSYAKMYIDKTPEDKMPRYLADLFCCEARRRIEAHFNGLSDNDDRKTYKLAKHVLDGKMKWMEEGIIWVGKRD